MDIPLLLGLSWLQTWYPYVNWRRGLLKFRHKAVKRREENPMPRGKKTKEPRELGEVAKEHPKREPRISKECWSLWDMVSEKGSDALLPHHPSDCSIEILPGAKLPKPKLYSMTLQELKELRTFINKNLK